ncbi:MAG: hypothetical protein ABJH52_08315 [Henriciella sp.]
MSPEDFGMVVLFLSVLVFADSLIAMPNTQMLISFSSSRDPSAVKHFCFYKTVKKVKDNSKNIFSFALLVFAFLIIFGFSEYVYFTLFVIICSFFELLKSPYFAVLQVRRDTKAYAAFLFLDSIIQVIIISALLVLNPTPIYYILGISISRVTLLIIMSFSLRSNLVRYWNSNIPRFDNSEEEKKFTIPLVLMGPIGWCGSQLDRVAIGIQLSPSATALFTAPASIIGRAFSILSNFLTIVYRPMMVKSANAGDVNTLSGIFILWVSIAAAAGFSASVVFAFFDDVIFRNLLAAPYVDLAKEIDTLLIAGFTALVIGHGVDNHIIARRKTGMLARIQTVYALVGSAVLVSFIFWLGILGAVWAKVLNEAGRAVFIIVFDRTFRAYPKFPELRDYAPSNS